MKKRIDTLFSNMVYYYLISGFLFCCNGLAPTEIIYKNARNFILGFDKNVTITDHHFRLLDALEYAKQGTLEAELDKVFK